MVKQWEETWSEVVPGEEATVRLYLPQLVGVASSALQSQSWPIKSQGAAALATVAEKMGESLSLVICLGIPDSYWVFMYIVPGILLNLDLENNANICCVSMS